MDEALSTSTKSNTDFTVGATWPLWVFSVLIVALSFKQLRMESFAGLAEWLTAIMALGIIAGKLRKGTLLRNPYILGAAIVFTALSLGAVWALIVEPQRINIREAAAYIFTFLVIAAFLALSGRRETRALTILAVVISLYLAFISLLALVPSPLQPAVWYYETRLQGFSNNPNQIALLALVALLLLARAEMRGILERRAAIPLALGCAVAGVLTKSSALLATSTVTLMLLIAFALFSYITQRRSPGAMVVRQPLSLGLACLVVLGHFAVEHPEWAGAAANPSWDSVTQIMESDKRQGAVRVELWSQALSVGARSPLVGLGPGY
ncbi:MAG TPA: hypothetical protein PK205_18675, partial [Promineifilum sp.]|nr:hypothetical protein [Hyphomicrobium sp.]HRQ15327.1 hypothetical protein [Promineifilum sp.]